MGVHGLWLLLSPSGKRIKIEQLKGKVLAIDVSIWVLKMIYGVLSKGKKEFQNIHLIGIFKRLVRLLSLNVKPVFVFDGKPPDLKRQTLIRRYEIREKRKVNLQKLAEKYIVKRLEEYIKNRSTQSDTLIDQSLLLENIKKDSMIMSNNDNQQQEQQQGNDDANDDDLWSLDSQEMTDLDKKIQEQQNKVLDTEFRLLFEQDPTLSQQIGLTLEYFVDLDMHQKMKEIQHLRRELNSKHQKNMLLVNNIEQFSKMQVENYIQMAKNKQKVLELQWQGRQMLMKQQEQQLMQEESANVPQIKKILEDSQKITIVNSMNNSGSSQQQTYLLIKGLNQQQMQQQSQGNNLGFFNFQSIFDKPKRVTRREKCNIIQNKLNELMKERIKANEADQQQQQILLQDQNIVNIDQQQKNNSVNEDQEKEKKKKKKNQVQKCYVSMSDDDLFGEEEDDEDEESSSQQNQQNSKAVIPTIQNNQGIQQQQQQNEQNSSSFILSREESSKKLLQQLQDSDNEYENKVLNKAQEYQFRESEQFQKDSSQVSNENSSQKFSNEERQIEKSKIQLDNQIMNEQNLDKNQYCLVNQQEKIYKENVNETQQYQLGQCKDISHEDDEEEKVYSNNQQVIHTNQRQLNHLEFQENQYLSQNQVQTSSSIKGLQGTSRKLDDINLADIELKLNQLDELRKTSKKNQKEDEDDEIDEDILKFLDELSDQSEEQKDNKGNLINNFEDDNLSSLELLQEYNKYINTEALDFDSVSSKFEQVKQMLMLFGVPWVEAPAEAEAQCAYLEINHLVDGVITDDSDVFLFGANNVYRGIFDRSQFIQYYSAQEILKELYLTREQIIHLALFLGSDYTLGIKGVGIVNAMEIVASFENVEALKRFKEWAGKADILLDNVDQHYNNISQLEKQYKEQHKNYKKHWELPEDFPNQKVMDAYINPKVDESKEKFQWGKPHIALLKKFCSSVFEWSDDQIDAQLEPLLKTLKSNNEEEQQQKITDFFQPQQIATINSVRIKNAIRQHRNHNQITQENQRKEGFQHIEQITETIEDGKLSTNSKKRKKMLEDEESNNIFNKIDEFAYKKVKKQ